MAMVIAPSLEGVPHFQTPRMFGVSVAGPSHVKLGIPCQDACQFAVLGQAAGVVAIADGLGSVRHSDWGASRAVAAAVAAVQEEWTRQPAAGSLTELAQKGMAAARRALEALGLQEGCPLDELACTLLVIVLHEGRAAAGQIGDGAAVVQTAAGLRLLSGPGEAEYVNEVTPLTARGWEREVRLAAEVADVRGLLAFTDGCQRAALLRGSGGHVPFPRFCDPLFAFAAAATDSEQATRELNALLTSPKLREHSEDDKTIVLAAIQA